MSAMVLYDLCTPSLASTNSLGRYRRSRLFHGPALFRNTFYFPFLLLRRNETRKMEATKMERPFSVLSHLGSRRRWSRAIFRPLPYNDQSSVSRQSTLHGKRLFGSC